MNYTNVRACAVRSRREQLDRDVSRRIDRCARRLLLLCFACCALTTTSVDAQQATSHALSVTVLRSNGPQAGGVADVVDAALLRDLPAIAGIDHAQLSPVEYEEVQLTVGCNDQSRQCLAAIANVAQVSGLIVRTVVQSGDALALDLVYFDVSSQDEPSHAAITGSAEALVAAVPSLVRKLFGIPEVPNAEAAPATTSASSEAAPAAATTGERDEASGGANGLVIGGIVTLGVGVGVTLIGTLMGVSAPSTFDDYKKIDVTDRASARRARDKLDDAQLQATLANVLLPTGGLLIAGGVVLLALGMNANDDDASAPAVSLAPTMGGGMMTISGAL